MVNLEENMVSIMDSETRVTTGEIIKFNGKKRGDCHGYQRRDRKLRLVTLSYTDVIPDLYANIFSVTQALKKGSQVT